MKVLGDRAGLALVLVALMAGIGVALAVNRTAEPNNPGGQSGPSAVASTPEREPDLSGANRTNGRLSFQSDCQGCHTQGRQAFDLASRERLGLISAQIRRGSGQMPAFPQERLSDADLANLLAYIAIPSEAEAPEISAPPLRGVNFEVLEASGQPGESPSIRFRIRDDAGNPIDPGDMTALNITVAGPTIDYQWVQRDDARRAENLGDGTARYVFRAQLPADARGTFAVATEGYRELPSPSGNGTPVRDVGYNAVSYFGVTDSTPAPRAQIVKTENCNACHGTLATHGGTRRNTEFCVMCHNATQTDADKRLTVAGPMPPQPVQFRNFIHRIHTGEDLVQPFVIYGGSPAAPQANDLRAVHPFPKDRANCLLCHVQDSYLITPSLEASAALRVVLEGETVREVRPVAAACTGCHDSPQATAHVASQTTNGVESCGVCHQQGRPYSVTAVHRIAAPR